MSEKLKDGQPCNHPGCLHHVSHPCEGCGRIAGRPAPSAPEDVREIIKKAFLDNLILTPNDYCNAEILIDGKWYVHRWGCDTVDRIIDEAAALIQAHYAPKLAALTAKVDRVTQLVVEFEAQDPYPGAPNNSIHGIARSLRGKLVQRLRAALADKEVEKCCATCGLDSMTADNAHSCDSIYACNAYDHWQPIDETKRPDAEGGKG